MLVAAFTAPFHVLQHLPSAVPRTAAVVVEGGGVAVLFVVAFRAAVRVRRLRLAYDGRDLELVVEPLDARAAAAADAAGALGLPPPLFEDGGADAVLVRRRATAAADGPYRRGEVREPRARVPADAERGVAAARASVSTPAVCALVGLSFAALGFWLTHDLDGWRGVCP